MLLTANATYKKECSNDCPSMIWIFRYWPHDCQSVHISPAKKIVVMKGRWLRVIDATCHWIRYNTSAGCKRNHVSSALLEGLLTWIFCLKVYRLFMHNKLTTSPIHLTTRPQSQSRCLSRQSRTTYAKHPGTAGTILSPHVETSNNALALVPHSLLESNQ